MIPRIFQTFAIFCVLVFFAAHQSNAFAEEVGDIPDTHGCAFDRSRMLGLDERAFDQDFSGGWRAVAKEEGCLDVAADLIRDYIDKHDAQSTILFFHEAQLRAMAGQTELALKLFPRTRKPDSEVDRFGWNYYVDATIAFLKKDKDELQRAHDSLAIHPKPEDFNPVDTDGNPVNVNWPPNLNVVDGFLECFDRDYDSAYSDCSRPFAADSVKAEQR